MSTNPRASTSSLGSCAASSPLHVGRLFAGRYRIESMIAAGGMGAVYEVTHLQTERRRALKVMLGAAAEKDDLRQRFQREAKVAGRIESEFVVDVFDAGVDFETGLPFMVMELLRGEDLATRLQRGGRLPREEAVMYLRQTAEAVDKIHRAGIVHRDLKPENLFLAQREQGAARIKVLDFGIAKLAASSHKETIQAGTPAYMAPEQFQCDQPATPAADVYAVGMLAFTLLVGAAYWDLEANQGMSVYVLAASAMLGPSEAASVRARKLGVELPRGFDAWFARATSMRPEQRFGSASAAVAALAAALDAGVPTASTRSEPPRAGGGWALEDLDSAQPTDHAMAAVVGPDGPRRRRSRLAVVAAVLIAASGLLVGSPQVRTRVAQIRDATLDDAAIARTVERRAPAPENDRAVAPPSANPVVSSVRSADEPRVEPAILADTEAPPPRERDPRTPRDAPAAPAKAGTRAAGAVPTSVARRAIPPKQAPPPPPPSATSTAIPVAPIPGTPDPTPAPGAPEPAAGDVDQGSPADPVDPPAPSPEPDAPPTEPGPGDSIYDEQGWLYESR